MAKGCKTHCPELLRATKAIYNEPIPVIFCGAEGDSLPLLLSLACFKETPSPFLFFLSIRGILSGPRSHLAQFTPTRPPASSLTSTTSVRTGSSFSERQPAQRSSEWPSLRRKPTSTSPASTPSPPSPSSPVSSIESASSQTSATCNDC
jgi:hypothetical protein